MIDARLFRMRSSTAFKGSQTGFAVLAGQESLHDPRVWFNHTAWGAAADRNSTLHGVVLQKLTPHPGLHPP
jgi:hypothetical protein